MPILNYRTRVAPDRTIPEIQQLLVRKGAQSVTTDYDSQGKPARISFAMLVGGFPLRFQLPVNAEGVARVLADGKQPTKLMKERAEWISWRILKDWVGAQIALIESGQAQTEQVFLPYALDEGGQTMFEAFVDRNQKRLGTGGR